jgi:hypothetical protein
MFLVSSKICQTGAGTLMGPEPRHIEGATLTETGFSGSGIFHFVFVPNAVFFGKNNLFLKNSSYL